MIKKNIKIILIFSLFLNFLLLISFCYIFLPIKNDYPYLIQQQKKNVISAEDIEEKELKQYEYSDDKGTEEYRLRNTIEYNQMFYGKWRIVDCISSDMPLPSSYYAIDEDGDFIGMDYTTILGVEITFGEKFVEYLGERHDLVYGPQTYTHALISETDILGQNYAKSLDITGNYYSIVYFVLPDNYRVTGPILDRPKEMKVSDLCFLYLKDNNTIYASDGNLTYLLERIY